MDVLPRPGLSAIEEIPRAKSSPPQQITTLSALPSFWPADTAYQRRMTWLLSGW